MRNAWREIQADQDFDIRELTPNSLPNSGATAATL